MAPLLLRRAAASVTAAFALVAAAPPSRRSSSSSSSSSRNSGGGDLEDACQLQQGSPKRAKKPGEVGEGSQDRHEAVCGQPLQIFPYMEAQLWGSAYDGWQQCAGSSQSPVNLGGWWPRPRRVSGPKLNITYRRVSFPKTLNNGHTLEVKGNYLLLGVGEATYEGSQIDFHHPSEHREGGKQAALEMHIATTGKQGVAIIGILFDIGAENACLAKTLENPPLAGCQKNVGPPDLSCFRWQLEGPWYSYTGSLTVPPCTEGVTWNVMTRRAALSLEQLETFLRRFEDNARPTQRLNGRTVTVHFPPQGSG